MRQDIARNILGPQNKVVFGGGIRFVEVPKVVW